MFANRFLAVGAPSALVALGVFVTGTPTPKPTPQPPGSVCAYYEPVTRECRNAKFQAIEPCINSGYNPATGKCYRR